MRLLCVLIITILSVYADSICYAQIISSYKTVRYEEDYSYLDDSSKRTDFYDSIKYIPLGKDPKTYISLGGEVRERYEDFLKNPLFGISRVKDDEYLLNRILLHADLHVTEHFRLFVQLGYHDVYSKEGAITSTERDRMDLQQGFVDGVITPGDDKLTLRVGRQEMYFGSQRLVSVREGPNIRQSFDAVRGIYEHNSIKVSSFVSHPVLIKQDSFDDSADTSQSFWGVYETSPIAGGLNADLYYLGLEREGARFSQGKANEKRHSIGTRLWGKLSELDYNFELVYQFGQFGSGNINAWTTASDTGYTFKDILWTPRLALRADIASGDRDPNKKELNTFNPLFPRGAYFTENALIGPQNFIDLHPYITLIPRKPVTVSIGSDFLWRESVHDAVYRQPNITVTGTQNSPDRFTGVQPYVLSTWQIDPHTSFTLTYVYFKAGEAIKDVGGGDSKYLSGWVSYKF